MGREVKEKIHQRKTPNFFFYFRKIRLAKSSKWRLAFENYSHCILDSIFSFNSEIFSSLLQRAFTFLILKKLHNMQWTQLDVASDNAMLHLMHSIQHNLIDPMILQLKILVINKKRLTHWWAHRPRKRRR